MARLRRSDCTGDGISRRRHGRGFRYLTPDGAPVQDRQTRARIEALRIPPAWNHVWICLDPLGHMQATGIDAAGRKQYLYHERWRAHRDRAKFDSMLQFGRSLPALRRKVAKEIEGDGLEREQVLACAARLLDLGFFRIGSEQYAEQNDSYGLATILRRHVRVRDGRAIFDYPAKSGQRRIQAIADRQAIAIVTALKRRRGGGPELLAYRRGRRWVDVRSEDINAYLKQATGQDFSAKDFRTWNATVLAAVALARCAGEASSRTARERMVADAVRTVATQLGNTPAVCRGSYIDPRLIDLYRSGSTIEPALAGIAAPGSDRARTRLERAVLELLDGENG